MVLTKPRPFRRQLVLIQFSTVTKNNDKKINMAQMKENDAIDLRFLGLE